MNKHLRTICWMLLGGAVAMGAAALRLDRSWTPAAAAQEARPNVPRWEYKVDTFERVSRARDFERLLNERGGDGWELSTAYEGLFVFKRSR